MNKKFSTLLAGMALLSVMSVNAQTTPSRVDPETVLGQEWRLGGLKEGANSGLYQLKVMDGTTPAYLAMELNRGTGDYELRVYSASEAKNKMCIRDRYQGERRYLYQFFLCGWNACRFNYDPERK